MKKLLKYSFLFFLFAFVAVACRKESDDVNPTSSLSSTSLNEYQATLGGFGLSCLSYDGDAWSFTVKGGSAPYGLSHLNLELLDCEEKPVCLAEGSITHATITVAGETYVAGQLDAYGNGFVLGYSDGSCTAPGVVETGIVKFEMKGELDDILKANKASFSFKLTDGTLLSGANVLVKTGGPREIQCNRGAIGTCEDYCNPVEVCSFSQGRYFNKGNMGKNWPAGVECIYVGNKKLEKGKHTLPATTAEAKALFQAGALVLSAMEQGIAWADYFTMLPESVRNAYTCIAAYYTDGSSICDLQTAASTIGDWIDENHCEE
ncbi:hypothetical protein [Pontibacter ramchanderi]|uniref:Lipoprotein n=1 Tax=Pontibacter ramchanderi TaxID=1179743 RepID=A0A2N3UBE0_9BACT|nr:hypothetical protein [Pontibacter ramchanderi]PKV66661.1 hypothetical protein BD749_1791 [Pontibacter ramchanderi]